MPITKSAKKALRQNLRRRALNTWRKRRIKELKKEIQRALQSKDLQRAMSLLPDFYKAVDKAVKKHTIKENKGNRLKSQVARLISGSSQK